jgi:hypothetical protein
MLQLESENILMGARADSKEDAIRDPGHRRRALSGEATDHLMRRIVLISLLLLSCGAKPVEPTHVFYLHGQIIEDQGRRPTHPEFGTYEYDEILRQLGGEGRVVVSEARPKDTDPDAYAGKVAKQIEDLLAKGVPGRRITVIGVSKGAVIAMLVSTKVRSPEVGYVIMANCNDWVRENFRCCPSCFDCRKIGSQVPPASASGAGVSAMGARVFTMRPAASASGVGVCAMRAAVCGARTRVRTVL